ncbi:MAG: hypothetical protein A2X86_20590 [Bdellovibrionales bacterium GWA2_49_15]|nr:MAG: hypothetical protein A2X86_20590 [Bdellovibrionales bacterium GWA2_49_15]HAZ11286.1 YkgJ family cysteine cluster protein [Bdellovibrionales bacterium]
MTELERLNQLLLDYFTEIEDRFSCQQKMLKLECLSGCGDCCLGSVTASLLEMLPLAVRLFQQGQADQIFQDLSGTSQESCYFYKRESIDGERGHCSIYSCRPLVCRVFGAFPRRDKWNKLELSVCKKIKSERWMAFEAAVKNLQHNQFEELSFSNVWKEKLMDLRPELATQEYPINSATLQAITFASMYFRM